MLSEGQAAATLNRRLGGPMACLLKHEPASHGVRRVKPGHWRSHSESESEEGATYGRTPWTRNRVSYPWPG